MTNKVLNEKVIVNFDGKQSESPSKSALLSRELYYKCLFCNEIFKRSELPLHLKYVEGLEW